MTLLLGWLLVNALVGALLMSEARILVLALGGFLFMALWFAIAGSAWFVMTPLLATRAGLRRLGLVVAR